MAEAFLSGPPQHTDTLTAGKALVATDTPLRPRPGDVPVPLPLGRAGQLGAAADGMEYARRLRAPLRVIADCGHLSIGERPDVVPRASREFLATLELDSRLQAPTASKGITSAPPRASRFDRERNSTRRATTSTASRRLPSCSQVRLLRRPSIATRLSLLEVLGAELGLAVPGGDPDEVRSAVAAASIDREQEARDLLVLARRRAARRPSRGCRSDARCSWSEGRRAIVTKESRLSGGMPESAS